MSQERYLVDTQVLVWLDQRSQRISRRLQTTLDSGFDVYFSSASAWEIAIKCSLGKISISGPLSALADSFGFVELPVTTRYVEIVAALPWHHRDPFDRLIVAQAMKDRLTLVTGDRRLGKYDVKLLQV